MRSFTCGVIRVGIIASRAVPKTPSASSAASAAAAAQRLETAGFVVDYAAIRRPDLGLPETEPAQAGRVALIAARLGRTRLIDNLEFGT